MTKKELSKEKTIFEKIISREISATIVYEDDDNIAFLNAFPFEPGHILVVPKIAYETIFDMPELAFLQLQKVVLKVARKVREATGQDIAIVQRNGKNAGQEVPHVHFHIVPRTISEVEKPLFNDGGGDLISEIDAKKFAQMFRFD